MRVCGPSSPNSLAATFSCTRLCPSSPPAVHYSVIHYNTSVAASRPRAPQSPLIPPPHPKRSGSLRSKSQHREPPCARPSEPPQIDQHAHLPPASHEKSRRNCTLTPWTAIIHLIRASDHSTATITRPRTQHTHRHFTCPLLSRRRKYPSRIPSHEVAIRFYQDHMGGKAVWDQARKGGHLHKVRERVCYTSVRSATRLGALEAATSSSMCSCCERNFAVTCSHGTRRRLDSGTWSSQAVMRQGEGGAPAVRWWG